MEEKKRQIPKKSQAEKEKNKTISDKQTVIMKESMRAALEKYKKIAGYKSKEEIYKLFSDSLEKELGYTIGWKQIENYFRPTPPAKDRPLSMPEDPFLYVWFAKKMGISLDDLLAGGRISLISTSSTPQQAVDAFVVENLKLTLELQDAVGRIETPELYLEGDEA